ncbi:unnamed protein product [Onchocerca ochengi]|uniref:Tho1_MOS11_C domain-containing protein n=1 Tax=Onchocerca ochengi TaxID=42157 RepID=A0A182E244_ONCOC|nr:unnamed protein product [Onchocerca ochengi]
MPRFCYIFLAMASSNRDILDALKLRCIPANEAKMFGEQFINSSKNVSPNSKKKITASVAPLKQEPDLPDQDEAEKFGRNDKMDKNGIPDIFKLSASEARSRLVSRKKDPRRDSQMSLKEKYKLVSNM